MLKEIFIPNKKSLNRNDYFVGLSLLWLINLFSYTPYIHLVLFNFISAQRGPEWLGAKNAFTMLVGHLWGVSIPWTFILLVGCILFSFNVLKKQNSVVQLISGLLIFGFFRSLALAPVFFKETMPLLVNDQYLIGMLEHSVKILQFLMVFLLLGGMGVIVWGAFKSKVREKNAPPLSPIEMDGKTFIIRTTLLSIIFLIVPTVITIAYIFFNKGNLDSAFLGGLLLLLVILAGIMQLRYMIHRLRNSPYSLWWLTVLLLAAILSYSGIYLVLYSQQIFDTALGDAILNLGFSISPLFFVFLALAPSKKLTK